MVKDDKIKLSKYKRRRLISSLMSTYPEKCDQGEGFRLKNNSDGFSQRLNSIFGGLKDFEQKHDDWCEKQKSCITTSHFKDDPVIEDADSSDPIFKRPVAVAPRKRKHLDVSIPEFRRHPEKWVKYSLSDVSGNDMSEISNKQIAMDFVEEMRKRKASLEVMDVGDMESEPIKYRNPVQKTDFNDTEASSGAFQNSKFIMPECVVGKKKQSSKLRSSKGENSSNSKVLLHHLECYDGEDAELREESSSASEKYPKGFRPIFKKPHYKNEKLQKDENI